MVTISDVAKRAGVSRSTVSYVFSGRRTISPEVRERVADAARELGYTANAGARALRTSQTRVIGLLAQFLEDEFAPAMLQYIQGVTDTARTLGYDVLLVTDPDGPAALRRVTDSRMVDGVVLLNVAEDDPRLPLLRSADQPGALIGLPNDGAGVDVFDLDFPEAGRLMVEQMAAAGHEEMLLISQPHHVVERGGAYVWRLRDGCMERAEQLGVRVHHAFAPSQAPEIGEFLGELLDQHPAVTGLLLNNEAAATALPGVLHQRGLSAPGDLSVIGRYSEEFARVFSLPFSSVESAPDFLGRLAVQHLVRRIEGPGDHESAYTTRLVAPVFRDRGSVGPAGAR
ncbi:LacI family DNA-binding transcriptional regulator [Nocardioides sp. GY 10127]|uniref:LacI family DNA-binding transcriptional regulator n=1 Tax=Nocardioides sp. GY 10127 TaxID=2569762 RepID=UPI0010A8E52D|nr:LacI family DNA-binding transcriptional regulator [Nocardioides sp. GY 10127]TIC80066.1 LacI family transcriptional regulator [Nocardioides sp. GY 10127]